MELRREVKQIQKLTLRKNLIQLMRLYHAPLLELREILNQEWEENPFLEVTETKDEIDIDEDSINFEEKGNIIIYESFLKEEKGLKDYLEEQLVLFDFSQDEEEIARFIIGNTDEHGFLPLSPKEIEKILKRDIESIESVLETLKRELHPPGVIARDIKEGIIIQLIRAGLIKDLKEAEKNIDRLLKGEKVPESFLEKIKKISIYPGDIIDRSKNLYITPELYLKIIDGEIKVFYNEKILPKVKFNKNLYDDMLMKLKFLSREERKFIKTKAKDAKNLVFLVEERKEKILRIAQYLIDKQKDFFLKDGYLNILTLKDVSSDLNLSISTVSRIIHEKYIDTPKGVFPLSFFLGKDKVKRGVFGTKVKMLIKKLIDEEDKNKPLSDGEIAKRLEKFGIFIKRRTVNKYREEMGIPSKIVRKRRKSNESSH
ncbi:MAG: RNA polymerase sigma-54 factor [Caldiserica bacterium]|nr:MAG: RNA polymerase sigma-54 factor [Caldisericota bacterium]